MYTLQLYLFLLSFITLLSLGAAQYLARAKAPTTTPAHLFHRQATADASCVMGATSCNDGQPGCCNIGQACTFDASHRPICAGSCAGLLACSGDMAGLCCNTGLTCNTQSTLCEANDLTMTSMTLTGPTETDISTVVATAIMTMSLQPASPPVTFTSVVSSQPVSSSAAPADTSMSQSIQTANADAPSQASSTYSANTLLPVSSEYYFNYTLPSSSSFSGPGLDFTYTTVFVADSSATSETSSSTSEAVDRLTTTFTATILSGQGRRDFSFWGMGLGCALALVIGLVI